MPIDYKIDHERKLVIARATGTLEDEEIFGYQRDVWSRPEVLGYDQLVDMTSVVKIAIPSSSRVKDLATLAADMDTPHKASKFAIVAPDDLSFGLGRMFEIYRDLDARSTVKVTVFRTMKEALAWLGVRGGLG